MNRRAFIAAAGTLPWAIAGCAHSPKSRSEWKQLAPIPNALGVAAPFAGVSGETLLVGGGANFPNGLPWEGGKKVWHDVVYKLDAPDGQWSVAGKLPRPLAYGVSVSTPQGLVSIGGSDSARHYPGAFRLDTNGESLRVEPLPDLPKPLANAAGALVGNRILVCGGSTEPGEHSALNQLWSLDLSKLSVGWRELAALPAEPRFLSIAASNDDAFYLFGGVGLVTRDGKSSRAYLKDAWKFCIVAGWNRLADLPNPLAAAPSPAPVVGNEILVLPGDDGSQFGFQPAEKHPGFARRILAYDLQHNTWRDAGNVPFAQVTTPCVRWRSRIVVPSGEVRPGVRLPTVWSLKNP